MRILAISGSLRAVSSNTALLRAAALLAPPGMEISLYEGLGDLPHFNPDLEEAELPAMLALRAAIAAADGLLFSVPEYAHGMPGSLKNALDWLVSGPEFVYKPVALLNAAPRATHAQAALRETVTTMSGRLVPEACIDVPLLGRGMDEHVIAADPDLSAAIRAALETFRKGIDELGRSDLRL
jgi:chromate reductase